MPVVVVLTATLPKLLGALQVEHQSLGHLRRDARLHLGGPGGLFFAVDREAGVAEQRGGVAVGVVDARGVRCRAGSGLALPAGGFDFVSEPPSLPLPSLAPLVGSWIRRSFSSFSWGWSFWFRFRGFGREQALFASASSPLEDLGVGVCSGIFGGVGFHGGWGARRGRGCPGGDAPGVTGVVVGARLSRAFSRR